MCTIAFADTSSGWLLRPQNIQGTKYGYQAPNEYYPERAIKIYQNVLPGVVVIVGADRCFNLASLAPKPTRILCIDADPDVVLFNLINIFWLRASESLEDYRYLRLNADFAVIEKRLNKIKDKLNPAVTAAINRTNLAMIREAFEGESGFARFHSEAAFKVNYMDSQSQYQILKKLADMDAIESHHGDLSEPTYQTYLAQRIDDRLSAIDVSNAWGDNYIGQQKLMRLLDQLSPKNPDSYLIYTDHKFVDSDMYDFEYGAVSLKNRSLMETLVYFASSRRQPPPFGMIDATIAANCSSYLETKNISKRIQR